MKVAQVIVCEIVFMNVRAALIPPHFSSSGAGLMHAGQLAPGHSVAVVAPDQADQTGRQAFSGIKLRVFSTTTDACCQTRGKLNRLVSG